MTDVDPEEAEALREVTEEEARAAAPATVLQRDFRRPRRLGPDALEALRQRIARRLPELDTALRGVLHAGVRTEIVEVSETSADGLFDDLTEPFALGSFESGGQPGWIQWDIRAAVKDVERLLGSDGDAEPRRLSDIENRILADVFATVLDSATRALEVEAAGLGVVKLAEDIASWREGGPDAVPHRLCVALQLESGEESSLVHLYLPGFAREPERTREAPSALGPHCHRVSIELGAYLGSAEIPLSSLLSLEIGDVIPLGTTLSDPLVLRVEGEACGLAELGMRNGNRAVRVLQVGALLEDAA